LLDTQSLASWHGLAFQDTVLALLQALLLLLVSALDVLMLASLPNSPANKI
jgi:hypothetical protein